MGPIHVLQAHDLLNHCSTSCLQIPAAFGDLEVLRLLIPRCVGQVDHLALLCFAVYRAGPRQINKQNVAALRVHWEAKDQGPQYLELVHWLAKLRQTFMQLNQRIINQAAAQTDSLLIMRLAARLSRTSSLTPIAYELASCQKTASLHNKTQWQSDGSSSTAMHPGSHSSQTLYTTATSHHVQP